MPPPTTTTPKELSAVVEWEEVTVGAVEEEAGVVGVAGAPMAQRGLVEG